MDTWVRLWNDMANDVKDKNYATMWYGTAWYCAKEMARVDKVAYSWWFR